MRSPTWNGLSVLLRCDGPGCDAQLMIIDGTPLAIDALAQSQGWYRSIDEDYCPPCWILEGGTR